MKQRKAISQTPSSNRIIQCPEFSTTPAVFISGTMSTVDVVPLIKTAGVVEYSGHCIILLDEGVCEIAFRCFI